MPKYPNTFLRKSVECIELSSDVFLQSAEKQLDKKILLVADYKFLRYLYFDQQAF